MIEITPQQLDQIKSQLNDAQMHSHFVIFESYDPRTDDKLRMITDYQSYLKLKKQSNVRSMQIVRDIVPVTDDLAMWAISETEAARAQDSEDVAAILKEVDYYINRVLKDNKLPINE